MLDLKYLRENLDQAEARLATRGATVNLSAFRGLDLRRRELLGESEALKAEKNRVSALIGQSKEKSAVQGEIVRMKEVAGRIKVLDEELRTVEAALETLLLTLPNLPHEAAPVGQSEEDNREVKCVGTPRTFPFPAKPHWEVGEELGVLDFERAVKLAGTRFAVLSGAGARLERALASYMLDLHTERHGYVEVLPPYIVNRETMTGTGQLPKFEADLFHFDDPDFFLIPTAEVPLTNLHRDEILANAELPVRYVAHTPCFRKEAGSYGKDTRGLIRQHQFNKVELVKFVRPEESDAELLSLLADAEAILQGLELPYRIIDLCTGDIGFSAARTFDLEVWLPGQSTYREISSCSNFRDFQARRANIRFRREEGAKPEFVHTINGSGLAVGRTLVAILENYQEADGSVTIPAALLPYMGGLKRIAKI